MYLTKEVLQTPYLYSQIVLFLQSSCDTQHSQLVLLTCLCELLIHSIRKLVVVVILHFTKSRVYSCV